MTEKDFVESFLEAVKDQWNKEDNSVNFWEIGYKKIKSEKQKIAIVLGWVDEYGLCVKMAMQPNDSIMQCDYDIDWNEIEPSEELIKYENDDQIKNIAKRIYNEAIDIVENKS